jgi:hypothetical protein
MKKIALLLAFACTSVYGFAQDVNTLISKDDVYRIIKTLSADDMQGRGTFTPGIEKAAEFIEGEYKQIGLEPMKGDDGYRQNFTMFRSKALKLAVSINDQPIAPENICASGAGASFNWTNSSDVQVEILSSDKNFRTAYRGYLSSHKKQLVLIDPSFADIFKRIRNSVSAGKVSFKPDTTGSPIVFVLGKFGEVKSFRADCIAETKELPLFNIVGVIPGKTKPNECVVFSGHYDHLGILPPVKGDSIANGADDDASGTTAVITLAKYYKKLNNNARTLIFVAFTAEELGEHGSQHFAQTVDPDKVMAMFNIEMIGKPSKFGENSAFITGFDRSTFGTILQKNLTNTPFKFYPDPYPAQNLFYRSDNASLAEVGVPAHTISTDQIDTDTLYHTVGDELSTLDIDNIVATIRAIALSSRTIVSGQDTPTRVPKADQ